MADTYLSRTPSSASNRKTWTISAWVKRAAIYDSSGASADANQVILGATTSASNYAHFYFTYDILRFYDFTGSFIFNFKSNAEFRDPAAWYHVVASCDTTQATESNRFKMYVNGSQITSWNTAVYPAQNADTTINVNGLHTVGRYADNSAGFFNGYMSEYHFIDGTAYAASTFGETGTTGVWVPKVGPTVTYGTNGFYLKFANSGAMGTDSSGQSNTLAVGGGTVRQVPDSPTNVFPTLNPLVAVSPSPTLSKGNLEATPSGNGNHTTGATQTMPENSGKWYAETVLTYVNNQSGGFTIQDPNNIKDSINTYSGQYSVYWQASGTDYLATRQGGSSETNSTNTTIAVGDIFQIAYDSTNGKVWFGRNNTWITGNPSTAATPTFSSITGDKVFTTTGYRVTSGSSYTAQLVNFGQDSSFGGNKTAQNNADANGKGDFYYAPPTGFLSLCTDNLSSALTIPVNDGSSAFHTQLYTGTGSARTITNDANSNFQPDWVWAKQRNDTTAHSHNLVDAIRGGTKTLYSNSNGYEETITTGITGFATDGFTIGTNAAVNNNSINYVAWQWKAGGTAPTNTYAVKVVSDSGNKYRFDDYGTSAITLELQEGGIFTFDQSDSSNAGHPLRFSSTADGTHGGGSEYTTGVTTTGTPGQAGAKTVITVAGSAPTLYYYCSVHSGMGGQANTGSLFGFTNVKGALQSVVSPNTTAGFSIVSYTGTGSNTTIGHGLSATPTMMLIKNRTDGSTYWIIYHKYIYDNVGSTYYYVYPLESASLNDATVFNSTAPTSSVFSVGTNGATNTSSKNYVAYCFNDIEGYQKAFSYTGNGSTDGTFCYLGFRPAMIILMRSDSARNPIMLDNKRNTYNAVNNYLHPNLSSPETGNYDVDFLSNGIKIRNSNATYNASNGKYFGIAFAENPFVTSTGKPVTAR